MLREVVNFQIISEEGVYLIDEELTSFCIADSLPSHEKKELLDRVMVRWDTFGHGRNRPITKLKEEDYKFILISPQKKNGKWGDICFYHWNGNSYNDVYYNFKVIFAIHNNNLKINSETPLKLGNDPNTPSKTYWLYNDKMYWENDSLDINSVMALIDARESKKQRKVEFLKGPVKKQKSRRYIEDDVKVTVWRRDNGRCVKCGSNKNLEFDHIIPVSMGGSSTERNLQLLCEICNREKGADLK